MLHYVTLFDVSGNAKNKKYDLILIDKQAVLLMLQLPHIKLEVRYKIFCVASTKQIN